MTATPMISNALRRLLFGCALLALSGTCAHAQQAAMQETAKAD